MAAILDAQTGARYGQVQFINAVVDFITTAEGREPCYALLDALEARREGSAPSITSIVLGDVRGVPREFQGRAFEIVDGESDAERRDREFREGRYLKPQEAADLLRVDARTVKRWAQQGKLDGFRTPGGHWRIDELAVRRMQHSDQPTRLVKGRIVTAGAVAEIDLGPCSVCRDPIIAGEEYASTIEASVDGTITKVSNWHAVCQLTGHDGPTV